MHAEHYAAHMLSLVSYAINIIIILYAVQRGTDDDVVRCVDGRVERTQAVYYMRASAQLCACMHMHKDNGFSVRAKPQIK